MKSKLPHIIDCLRKGGFKVNIEYKRKLEGIPTDKTFRKAEIREINEFADRKALPPVDISQKGGETVVTVVDLRTFKQAQTVVTCHDSDNFRRGVGASLGVARAMTAMRTEKFVPLDPIYLNRFESEIYQKFKTMTPEEQEAHYDAQRALDLADKPSGEPV